MGFFSRLRRSKQQIAVPNTSVSPSAESMGIDDLSLSDPDASRPVLTSKSHKSQKTSFSAKVNGKFILSEDVAHRFNAYATAAFPNEIGGLLKIEKQGEDYVAVDLAILEQEVSPCYFEFTDTSQAEFIMGLATSGRADEIPQWFGMVHSHPNMAPFMSGTDVKHLWKLAGTAKGFSLICSASNTPESNYFSVNYAQAEMKIMVSDLPVHGSNLSGMDTISAEDYEEIKGEVSKLTSPLTRSYSGNWGSKSARGVGYVPTTTPLSERDGSSSMLEDEKPWHYFAGQDERDTSDNLSLFAATSADADDFDDFDDEDAPGGNDPSMILVRMSSWDLDLCSEAVDQAEAQDKVTFAGASLLLEALWDGERAGGCHLHVDEADEILTCLGEFDGAPDDYDADYIQELIDRFSEAIDQVADRV